jgi:hypothetical protein
MRRLKVAAAVRSRQVALMIRPLVSMITMAKSKSIVQVGDWDVGSSICK